MIRMPSCGRGSSLISRTDAAAAFTAQNGIGRQRGFALLIVLWAMVLLSLLFARLVSAGRGEVEIAFNLRHAAELQAQADGLLENVVFGLLGGSNRQWSADGRVHRVRLKGATAAVSVVNLAGRINPNIASPLLLYALLHAVGADATTARDVAEAIVDWRSPDAQGRYEAPQYLAAGLSYRPAGSPFQSIAELGLVLGMTPNLLERLAPHLSLYNANTPDPRFADSIVRQALKDTGTEGAGPGDQPLRDVAVNVVIHDADGTEASRVADVELNTSNMATGYKILTWQTLP